MRRHRRRKTIVMDGAQRHVAAEPLRWPGPHELSADDLWPAPIGWYPDPAGGDGDRLWDGEGWTDHLWHHRPSERRPPLPTRRLG